jgi:ABC-type Mn2+/Zn2+ transport system permease subunit
MRVVGLILVIAMLTIPAAIEQARLPPPPKSPF